MDVLIRAIIHQAVCDYRLLRRYGVIKDGWVTSRLADIGRKLSIDKMSQQDVVSLIQFIYSDETRELLDFIGLNITTEDLMDLLDKRIEEDDDGEYDLPEGYTDSFDRGI